MAFSTSVTQCVVGSAWPNLLNKVEPPQPWKGGGTDDIGDISWVVPMVYLRFPANIPNLPANAIAMATPLAHKGSVAVAKVQAATALDFLLKPELIAETDQPALELNAEKMAKYRQQMRKFYYDPAGFPTYLNQLGITYPTLKK